MIYIQKGEDDVISVRLRDKAFAGSIRLTFTSCANRERYVYEPEIDNIISIRTLTAIEIGADVLASAERGEYDVEISEIATNEVITSLKIRLWS